MKRLFWGLTLAAVSMCDAVPLRILPMDPELSNVDSQRGEMSFYCPELDKTDGVELIATAGGSERRVAVGADRKAKVAFGALPVGRHKLAAKLVDAKTDSTLVSNAYEICVVDPVAMPPQARRLNNFVTELGRFAVTGGKVKFFNPRDGWVYLKVGEVERMRWMRRGDCVAAMPAGECVVRLVKPIYHGGLEFASAADNAMCPFTREFHDKWVRGAFNMYSGAAPADWVNGLREEGCEFLPVARIRSRDRQLRSDIGAMVKVLEAAECGDRLAIDEMSLTLEGEYNRNFGEACWQSMERGKKEPLVTFWCDVIDNVVQDPSLVASALSAAMNSGEGRGLVATEHYLCARPTAKAALQQIDKVVEFSRSVRSVSACGPRHVAYYLGGYLRPGDWNAWCSPEPDMKAYYVMFLRRLAVDPEFADIGGVGFSRFYCDEEIARFACAAIRHYCIEGNVDDMNAGLGYRYLPRLLQNGDFDRQLEGWVAKPAEPGSLTIEKRAKMGRKEQGRIGGGSCGDSFALFTSSETGPNELSQSIKGLVPGKCYSLGYVTADYDDVLKPGSHPTNELLNVSISNVELIEPRGYVSTWPPERFPSGRKSRAAVTLAKKVVFRATAPEAKITFSDWDASASKSSKPNAKALLNYISVRPYFEDGSAR